MTKEYFKPIKFNEVKEEGKKKEKSFPPKHEWSPALDEIVSEIHKLETGASRFRTTGIQIKGNLPAMNALTVFAQDPNKKVFKSLLKVLPQDFGSAGEYFVKLLKKVVERHNEE